MILTLVIVACGGALAMLWYRQRDANPPQKKPTVREVVKDFASVELRCGKTACKTARDLAGQPILAVEAPVLPLANCDAATCQCSYRKIDDRRQDIIGRRTSDHGIEPLIFDGREQRGRADRRT